MQTKKQIIKKGFLKKTDNNSNKNRPFRVLFQSEFMNL